MQRIAKILLLSIFMSALMLPGFADRGVGKKTKKIALNIRTNGNLSSSLSLNLKNGLKYKGSLISNIQSSPTGFIANTIVSYQKGNSIYILPYKQKLLVPELKQGYTGMKLIIKAP
jgi:hypothetical protein